MSVKRDQQQLRRAKQLTRELQTQLRAPGVLLRLCRWEQRQQRLPSIARHYQQD